MLTRHNTNRPRDEFQPPPLKAKLTLSSLWQAAHDLFTLPNYVLCLPRSLFLSIRRRISTTHTHSLAAKQSVGKQNLFFFFFLVLLPSLSPAHVSIVLYMNVRVALCASILPATPSIPRLPDKLTFIPRPSNSSPAGFNGTYFLALEAGAGCIVSLLA